jgi:hypothetical protein
MNSATSGAAFHADVALALDNRHLQHVSRADVRGLFIGTAGASTFLTGVTRQSDIATPSMGWLGEAR